MLTSVRERSRYVGACVREIKQQIPYAHGVSTLFSLPYGIHKPEEGQPLAATCRWILGLLVGDVLSFLSF